MARHRALSAAVFLALFVANGLHDRAAVDAASLTMAAASDACALLTTDEASAALEVKSLAGRPVIAGNSTLCIWTDSATDSVDHRRITLAIANSTTSFSMAKASGVIPTETASGIGDEAYYALPKGESPILRVRKSSSAFTLRILNGLKLTALTVDQVKAKEATLAKAAVARF